MRVEHRVALIAVAALVAVRTSGVGGAPGMGSLNAGPGSDLAGAAERPVAAQGSADRNAGRPEPGAAVQSPVPTERVADASATAAGRVQEQGREAAFGGASGSLVFLSEARWTAQELAVVRGFDLAAPRPLTLWRVSRARGRAAPVAHGASGPDGGFAFEMLSLPGAGAELAVTPRGGRPLEADAAASGRLPPLPAEPPRVELEAAPDGGWLLRVPSLAPGGALFVADARGHLLGRWEAPSGTRAPHPERAARIAPPPEGFVLVAQERADGRRSAWLAVSPSSHETRAPEEEIP